MTPEARAARERKQKIFVVAGGIFLLAMLAIQLPRLLGGSGAPTASATPPVQEASAPGSSAPVALTAPSSATPAPRGKLSSLGSFEKKNPFVQLVVTGDAPIDDASPAGGEKKKAETGGGKPTGFSVGEKAAARAVTIVSVNGSRQTLQPGATFPASDPVFVLLAEQPTSKSVVFGVVGGAYQGGSKKAKLTVGKPLTLVNTATGAKYKVRLVSVGSGDAPEKPASSK
ncbi:MAG TPA: hypothetical protein VLA22_10095 [Gaiellaceae bacterium]|nr:hypothetical protein [Gaiellaceae bacterium]